MTGAEIGETISGFNSHFEQMVMHFEGAANSLKLMTGVQCIQIMLMLVLIAIVISKK